MITKFYTIFLVELLFVYGLQDVNGDVSQDRVHVFLVLPWISAAIHALPLRRLFRSVTRARDGENSGYACTNPVTIRKLRNFSF